MYFLSLALLVLLALLFLLALLALLVLLALIILLAFFSLEIAHGLGEYSIIALLIFLKVNTHEICLKA